MKKYIIGVDGGNTKTDYFLFDNECNFIDFHRAGTCSHEGLPDSFEGSYRVMKEEFTKLFERNNITVNDISAAVFGLAGVDTPYQKKRLEEVVSRLGFTNYKVVNDSFLGIKAGSTNGSGVCSINGTGTSAGGIDEDGTYIQVGGIGGIVGDEAGGSWLSRRAITETYNYYYRFGKKTLLSEYVFSYLEIDDPYYLMEAISDVLPRKRKELGILGIKVFECARKGDEVSLDLLKEMANNLARSAGGCVKSLNFQDGVDVILAGSVWVKGDHPILIETFKEKINEYTKKKCNIIVLTVPPATGAIIWAKELVDGKFPDKSIRELICEKVQAQLEKIESRGK